MNNDLERMLAAMEADRDALNSQIPRAGDALMGHYIETIRRTIAKHALHAAASSVGREYSPDQDAKVARRLLADIAKA